MVSGDVGLEEIADVAAAASMLKMFIRELVEPVIPQKFQKMLERDFEKDAKDTVQLVTRFKHLMEMLPSLKLSLMKYLCRFMVYAIMAIMDVTVTFKP